MGQNVGKILISIFMIIFLADCNNEKETTIDPDLGKKNNHKYLSEDESGNIEFITSDKIVTFLILNYDGFSLEVVNEIKKKTLNAYDQILDISNLKLDVNKKIIIKLSSEPGMSYYDKGIIELHNIDKENEYLVHELAHALLGYDFESGGYFTLDGIAMYMEQQITSNDPIILFSLTIEQMMNFLISEEIYVPLIDLLDPQISAQLIDLQKQNISRWLFYVETWSFAKYLIDTYGIEKFMQIYNQKEPIIQIEKIYGKKFEEITTDWENYIASYSINLDTIEDKIPTDFLTQIKAFNYLEWKETSNCKFND